MLCFPLQCGESVIRTRETLLAFTRFPGVPLQPLEHLSFRGRKDKLTLSNCQNFSDLFYFPQDSVL